MSHPIIRITEKENGFTINHFDASKTPSEICFVERTANEVLERITMLLFDNLDKFRKED